MRNTLKAAALCVLATSSVFASPDDYEKKSSDAYGNGTLVKIGKEIPRVFNNITEGVVRDLALDQKIEITVRDIDGQDVKKALRYQVDGFFGENDQSFYSEYNRSRDRMGLLPFKVTLVAEDGSDISIEEARLALFQFQEKRDGITAQILEAALDRGASFSTDAIEKMKTADLLNISISDALYTFEGGNMITFNGFAKAGWVADLESYGQEAKEDSLSDTTRIEYGSALGVKFRKLIGQVDVTPEVFNRKINFNKSSNFEVSRTGIQVTFETSFSDYSGCSASIGVAEEEVEGQFVEDNKEVYLATKCEF